ncbi:MAG: ArdC-like ssDNA-binding domain-containing protein [Ferrimicrobium sp.]|jgi:antirestriction protein ArdC|nr:ArdC-like ssDNA-binding domain-containing protein [Ferrimicrobium sp.]
MVKTHDHVDLLNKLTDGIANLASSSAWRDYLRIQSRFHDYSFNNTMLIAQQCPTATKVAGFRTWLGLGRHVMRGEKAIWIVAPLIYRDTTKDDDPESRSLHGFRYVPVFDIAQTEGDDLPEACIKLDGQEPAGCYQALTDVGAAHGFSVQESSLPVGVNGLCRHQDRSIQVEAANSGTQRVKTLAHELTHALLHENEHDRQLAELEAESTAYVICQALGIDSGDYTFGYVTLWAGGSAEAITKIRMSAERIQKTAAAILSELYSAKAS